MDPSSVDLEMAKHLHQLVTGYRASQVVSAIARFRIADQLADGPLALDALAVRLDIAHDHLYRLLRGAASVGLIEEVTPRTFAIAPLGKLLRSDVAGSLRKYAMALNAPGHWLPWARLPHAVVSRQAQAKASLGADIVEYHRQHPDEAGLLAEALSDFNELLSADIVRRYDFSSCRRVVDIGRWQGALLAAVLGANPAARGLVFDDAESAEEARGRLQGSGLVERSEVVSGENPGVLPPGADVYLLEQLLQDRPDDEAAVILRRCREAMTSDGRSVVVETVLFSDDQRARSQLSDLDALVITGGRQRTEDAHRALFASAGLELQHVVRLELQPDFAVLVGGPA